MKLLPNDKAVAHVLAEGIHVTYDLGGSRHIEMADTVQRLKQE